MGSENGFGDGCKHGSRCGLVWGFVGLELLLGCEFGFGLLDLDLDLGCSFDLRGCDCILLVNKRKENIGWSFWCEYWCWSSK